MFLNCHSWFSFHYGTLSVEKLLEEAQRLGIRKIVLTDINNTSGVLDFIRLAPKYGVEPAVGIEFRQGDTVRFIGIAKNNEGFEELNRFLSECLRKGAAEGESSGNRDAIIPEKIPCFRNVVVILPVTLSAPVSSSQEEALSQGAATGERLPASSFRLPADSRLPALSYRLPAIFSAGNYSCVQPNSSSKHPVASSLLPETGSQKLEAGSRKPVAGSRKLEASSEQQEAKGQKREAGSRKPEANNIFYGIKPSDVSRLPFSNYKQLLHRCVVLWPVTVRHKTDFNVHRLLCAIGHNTLLSKVPPEVNCRPDEIMVTEAEVRTRYLAFPQIVRNTEQLLHECHIAFDFHEPKNKRSFSGSRQVDTVLLERETWKGVHYRYGEQVSSDIRDRVEKELRMINELGFAAYFLVNWDIVRYAQRRGYFYVGRGSGANSIVAYCLRITDVDPIDLDLYFERFINPYRQNPPDFDLDFSWKDRDDLTAYIFRRHGEEHTALLATYSTYQSNAVIRELGKVFGLPKEEIDALQATKNGESVGEGMAKLIRQYSALLHDFPHHLSIHAGGVIISEKPITCYTALNHPPKGFPVTQFSMLESEDVGLYKYDILSQRGLGHIRDAVDIVKKNRGIDIDIHQIKAFKKDEKIKALIRNGRCMGCFYVESPAMRMLLKKLQVDTYIQLVAASSIIRPGVARSGMMREYILRTHDPARRTYIHPVMKELMEETYGIMVYQEDVIKVAHHFAGLDLSEADVLRRGMSGKFRSREEFQKISDKFFDSCKEKGYPDTITAEVWRQIESFAGYSFSKGHSASYAVESYQSLYLKAHYPLEFMVGVINNFGGFYSTEFYVHEARMQGATVHAPHINESLYLTDIQNRDIYLGFIHLQNLQQQTAIALLEERDRNGPFTGLADFMHRVPIEIEQLRILVRIGAFRFTGRSKKELLWDLLLHIGDGRKTEVYQSLFNEPSFGQSSEGEAEWKLPPLTHHHLEDALDEIELLGFELSSPYKRLRENNTSPSLNAATAANPLRPPRLKEIFVANELYASIGQEISIIGYLVTTKPTRTIKGEYMAFGTWLDVEGYFFDSTHFPRVIKEFPFRGKGIYRITGRVDSEFDFCSITVSAMEKLPTAGI
jgi:DNA-directed DNA polymerase III PolC